jgi:hypothetical protein
MGRGNQAGKTRPSQTRRAPEACSRSCGRCAGPRFGHYGRRSRGTGTGCCEACYASGGPCGRCTKSCPGRSYRSVIIAIPASKD